MDAIVNRLKKNYDRIAHWSQRNHVEAFRIYDRDIPEYPFILDLYKDIGVIYDKSNPFIARDKEHFAKFQTAVKKLWPNWKHTFVKQRRRQEGQDQYERLDQKEFKSVVSEGKALFHVNLSDYVDTGLFLDHRSLRYKVFKTSKLKHVLNLFCYTGSFSVQAALGGGKTTSIDMSKTYIEWAQENFKLNQIPLSEHTFHIANVLDILPTLPGQYDLIILDPPTFSNSKKMIDSFEVERDQDQLIDACMKVLKKNGILYFSCNKRTFKISPNIMEKYQVKNITKDTIPIDFHDQKIHHCFEIVFKSFG
ncbi:MAG: class I SAM-dependent methyltransferase [Bdellovibrionaceae bacterium]|nr:class I SAM-dependent methyltransferase [Pseudobdellovibrionaceae bacterium]